MGELEFFLLIYSVDGDVIASVFQRDSKTVAVAEAISGRVRVEIQSNLVPGKYFVSTGIMYKRVQFIDWVDHAESFIVAHNFDDGRAFDRRLGKTTVRGSWSSPDADTTISEEEA